MASRLNSDRRRLPVPVGSDPAEGRDAVRAARQRRREQARQRRLIVAGVMLVTFVLTALGLGRQLFLRDDEEPSSQGANAATPMLARPSQPVNPPPEAGPAAGAGTFAYATTEGPVAGGAGAVKKYRVAVENGSGQQADPFAAAVEQTFADPRGWTAGGQLRLQRVAGEAPADFTIFLATPKASEAMCASAGLYTDGYSSCRTPGKVVINLARWLTSVADYGASVADYQTYIINHEVGQELGNGHEGCPGPGRPAPVMQQQTFGLQGCVANSWPYLDGQRYSGPKVP